MGKRMKIIYRVCEKQETMSFVPRWKNISKLEIIKKCWLSVQANVNAEEDTFYIFEDACSKNLLDWMQETAKAPIEQIISIPEDPRSRYEYCIHAIMPFDFLLDDLGPQNPKDLIYLCNDDFLHLPMALPYAKSVYEDGWTSFVTTYDYPDRYTLDKTRNCDLLINRYTHWRTIPCCTGVTIAPGEMWVKHKETIKRSVYFNSDAYTWEVYGKEKAICPIPGLSTHLTQNCLTPLINWEAVWDSIQL